MGTFCSLQFVPVLADGLILSTKTTQSVVRLPVVAHAPHFFDEGTNYISFWYWLWSPFLSSASKEAPDWFDILCVTSVLRHLRYLAAPEFTFLWCHSHKHKPTAVLNSVTLAYSKPIQCHTHGWLINFSWAVGILYVANTLRCKLLLKSATPIRALLIRLRKYVCVYQVNTDCRQRSLSFHF